MPLLDDHAEAQGLLLPHLKADESLCMSVPEFEPWMDRVGWPQQKAWLSILARWV